MCRWMATSTGRIKNSTGSSLDDEFFAYVDMMLGSIDGILLGRTTYEGFAAHWPNSTQTEATRMNTLPKCVASTTLRHATWSNTTIIADDVPKAVAHMKQEPGGDLAIIGSSVLASTLAAHSLIDEYRFFVVPVLLGRGKRFLEDLPDRLALTLKDTQVSPWGVVTHDYTPTDAAACGPPMPSSRLLPAYELADRLQKHRYGLPPSIGALELRAVPRIGDDCQGCCGKSSGHALGRSQEGSVLLTHEHQRRRSRVHS
jgi:dihydrofolate reductase